MSLRVTDLAINLLEPRRDGGCGENTARPTDFCPTASATLGITEAIPSELDVLREQLRDRLGK